ncbi:hypothetical protein DM02DRAFT_507825, partial [Periconia macrospinosa]
FTVWLFPYSQWLDTILPCTLFAVCSVLSGSVLGLPNPPLYTGLVEFYCRTISCRTTLAMLWLWLAMLQFCLHNQRRPESIEEDRINKPWRPLPSGRISIEGVNRILLLTYVAISWLSFQLGVMVHLVVFTIAVFWYNDFGGSDRSGLYRNFLNATGYSCLFSAPLRILIGLNQPMKLTDRANLWTAIMVLVIFSTIHAQEYRDEEGDQVRGRRTILTSIGNTWSRMVLIAFVMFWSSFAQVWLQLTFGSLMTWLLGFYTISLTLFGINGRTVHLDKRLYKAWSCWLLSFSVLPLM